MWFNQQIAVSLYASKKHETYDTITKTTKNKLLCVKN